MASHDTLRHARVELTEQEGAKRRLTLTGSTLRARSVAFKGALARQLHATVWPLLQAGTVRPLIHQVFPATDAAGAHALMESSAHIGKIMLQW